MISSHTRVVVDGEMIAGEDKKKKTWGRRENGKKKMTSGREKRVLEFYFLNEWWTLSMKKEGLDGFSKNWA